MQGLAKSFVDEQLLAKVGLKDQIERGYKQLDIKELQKDKIEILESVRFWIAVLRKADGFTDIQKRKLDIAYHEVNQVYDNFETENVLDQLLSRNQL